MNKSKIIQTWNLDGGNKRGAEWHLKPCDTRAFTVADIPSLPTDQVNIIANISRTEKSVICTVAQLESQERPFLWLADQIQIIKTKRIISGTRIPTGEDHRLDVLLQKFLKKKAIKLNACAEYERHCNFWSKKLGRLEIGEITAVQIANIRDELLGNYAHATVRNYLSTLSSAYQYGLKPEVSLVKSGVNPVRLVDWPDLKGANSNKRQAILHKDSQELKSLISACTDSRSKHLKDLVFFCLEIGCRISEAKGLTWDKIDLKNGWICFEQALRSRVPVGFDDKKGRVIYKNNIITKGLKNDEQARKFPLEGCENSISILRRRKIASQKDSDRVFPADVGKAWQKVVKAAGLRNGEAKLERICFHSLRHTCASWQIQSGEITLYEVQHRLGHKSSQSTERYAHWNPEAASKGSSIVSSLLSDAINE